MGVLHAFSCSKLNSSVFSDFHQVKRVKVGLPIVHDSHSYESIVWKVREHRMEGTRASCGRYESILWKVREHLVEGTRASCARYESIRWRVREHYVDESARVKIRKRCTLHASALCGIYECIVWTNCEHFPQKYFILRVVTCMMCLLPASDCDAEEAKER